MGCTQLVPSVARSKSSVNSPVAASYSNVS